MDYMRKLMGPHRDKVGEDHIVFIVFIFLCFFTNPFFSSVYGISYFIVIFCAGDILLKRFVAYNVNTSSYHQTKSVLWHVLDMNRTTWSVIVICSSLVWFKWNFINCDMYMCIAGYYFLRTIQYDNSVYSRSYGMFHSDGLDYGSGMAYSFFHGYLNILLPDKGDNNIGIEENMTKYENSENITFNKKKLFILVPSMLYSPPDLKGMSGKRGGAVMEAAKTLDSIHRDRAGVINRTYKNSVYKIFRDSNSLPIYVAAEGATPLQTLHESLKSTSKHSEFYNVHKADIVRMFYETLVYLIDSHVECKDRCEVVYFNNDNEDVNVGEILLNRILKSETKSSLNQ